MSVNSIGVIAGPYAGDGTTTNLPYANYFIEPSDLLVLQTNYTGPLPVTSQLVLNVGYTVTGQLDPALGTYSNGGTVVLTVPNPVNVTSLIVRRTPILQPVPYQEYGMFPMAAVLVQLDRLTLIAQEENSFYGTVIGTSYGNPNGIWGGQLNQVLINGVMIPGGNIGWVCTTPGAPGTAVWNPFGAISLAQS